MNRINLFVLLLGTLLVLPSCQKETADPTKPTQAQMEQAQEQIDKLIRDLQAPQESYLITERGCTVINTIRRQSFQKHGIEWFCPWTTVTRLAVNKPTIASQIEPLPVGSLPKNDKLPRTAFRKTRGYNSNFSPENVWLNRSLHACSAITSRLRERSKNPREVAYRELLNPNSSLWKNQVRPLLLLLSQAPRFGIGACDALVAGGDRSEYLKQRLTHFLHGRERYFYDYDDVAKLITECGWDVPPKYPTLKETAILQVKPAMQKRLTTREDGDTWVPMVRIASVADQGRKIELNVRRGYNRPIEYIQVDLVDQSVTQVKNTIRWHNRVRATGRWDELVRIEYIPTEKTNRRKVTYDAFLVLREPKTRTVRWRTPLRHDQISSLQVSTDVERIVAIEGSGMRSKLAVYKVSNGELLFRQAAPEISPVHFVYNEGSRREGSSWPLPAMVTLGAGHRDSKRVTLTGWNAQMLPRTFNSLIRNSALTVTPDRKTAVTISNGDFVNWDLSRDYNSSWNHDKDPLPALKRYRIQTILPREPAVLGFGFTPDGKYLAFGLRNGASVAFWTPEGQCVGRLSLAEGEKLRQVRWVGDRLLAVSNDCELTVWNWFDIAAAIQERQTQ